jgi:hypothetical protein
MPGNDGGRARLEARLRRQREQWLSALGEATDFRAAFAVCRAYARNASHEQRISGRRAIPGLDDEREALRLWVAPAERLVARHDALVAFAGMLHREGVLADEGAHDAAIALADGLLACWLEDDGLGAFAEALESGDYRKMAPPSSLRLSAPPELELEQEDP